MIAVGANRKALTLPPTPHLYPISSPLPRAAGWKQTAAKRQRRTQYGKNALNMKRIEMLARTRGRVGGQEREGVVEQPFAFGWLPSRTQKFNRAVLMMAAIKPGKMPGQKFSRICGTKIQLIFGRCASSC